MFRLLTFVNVTILLKIILHHKSCLITQSKDLYPLKGYEKNYLVKSKSSGFVFCSKIPTEAEILKHYSNYPIGYGTDSKITTIRIHEALDEFEKYRKTNRLLDVGCGPGLFLIEAQKRGWEVFGTEFTDKQLAYLNEKGITTVKGKLTESSFEPDFFDVIISSEVIEHINNPIEEMKHFYRLLRKGGLVYITTPNFNAIERFILKGDYNIIEYPEHLCYYTPDTINLLLTKSGFQKVKITTTGISVARLKNSKQKKSSENSGEKANDEHLREQLEVGYKRKIKNIVNGLLNFFGVGNSLKAWYVKI
ncbi:MAG: class I SAM-dependent methyltransferase [Flavobacteriales bacterium]|nr:class I SAM-dependent methyltransferase [Flavobacteriales bacterium]